MSEEDTSGIQPNVKRRYLDVLARPAKVLGATALSGLAGYASAKGFEVFVAPVQPSELYEVACAVGCALLGGFIAAETIDS